MDRMIIYKNTLKKAIEKHKVACKKYEWLLQEIADTLFDKDDRNGHFFKVAQEYMVERELCFSINLNRWFNLYSETSLEFNPDMITHATDKFEFFKNGEHFIHYDLKKKKYPTSELDKMVGKALQGEFSPRK